MPWLGRKPCKHTSAESATYLCQEGGGGKAGHADLRRPTGQLQVILMAKMVVDHSRLNVPVSSSSSVLLAGPSANTASVAIQSGEGGDWQHSRQHVQNCKPTCSRASSYLRPSSIDHKVVGNSCCHCLLTQLYLQQSKAALVLSGLPSLSTNSRYAKGDLQLAARHKPAQHSAPARQTSNSMVWCPQ